MDARDRVLVGLLLSLLLLAPVLAADDDWAYKSSTLTLDVQLSSEIKLKPTSGAPSVDMVSAELTFVPLSTPTQNVLSFESVPDADIKDGSLLFQWYDPSPSGTLPFYWRSSLETHYNLPRVSSKVRFPLSRKETLAYDEYLQYTENIDVDADIRALANELAEGEDDLYELVFKVSEWMKTNVEYNLDFSETLDKPTQVMRTRQGVCDEFTALFVSILRTLNIPTKYVSGYAYTNLKTPADFGPHAWAEVYFPGTGWVPFDLTYNEFGFTDASHIKLKDSFDSGTYSARYSWKAVAVDLESRPLDFDAEVFSIGAPNDQRVGIVSRFLKAEAGFGSYNLLEVEVENLNNFYTGMTVYVSRSDELDFADGNTKDVLLKPFEKKRLYWLVHLHSDLDKDFQYSIPVRAYLADGTSSDASFVSHVKHKVYSKFEMDLLLDFSADKEEKTFSKDVGIECSVSEDVVYVGMNGTIVCSVENTGNVKIDALSVCINKYCKTISLGIAQTLDVQFVYPFSQAGSTDIFITAENNQVNAALTSTVEVYEYPALEIKDIIAPSLAEYEDRFRIEFLLHKSTGSAPKDITVAIRKSGEQVRAWDLPNLGADRRFIMDYGGFLLDEGQNSLDVFVTFKDDLGKSYSVTQSFGIELTNVSLAQKSYLFASRVGKGKSSFDLLVLVIFAFAMGGVIGFVLKGLKRVGPMLRRRREEKQEVVVVPEAEQDTAEESEYDEAEEESAEEESGEDAESEEEDEEEPAPLTPPKRAEELKPPQKEVKKSEPAPKKAEEPKRVSKKEEPKDELIKKLGKKIEDDIKKKYKEIGKK